MMKEPTEPTYWQGIVAGVMLGLVIAYWMARSFL
jgi:hypothetical protein